MQELCQEKGAMQSTSSGGAQKTKIGTSSIYEWIHELPFISLRKYAAHEDAASLQYGDCSYLGL